MGNGAQRIPSWPGALAPTKAEYICADQPVTLTFRLRQGGGPYMAGRKRQSIAVLFLDLDHFKRFNDTFGHDAGDMVLQSLADLLRNFFRATDICCRYGGEEFAIILTESTSREAAIRADALRSEVKGLRLQYKKQPLGPLTLSIGVSAFPEHGSTSEDLLKIADQCLYESKNRGRDIVTVALAQNA